MPAAAADASPPVPAAGLLDFADRWPAMVVKELRQGLRARGFVVPFLVLHALVLGAVAVEYLLTRTGSGGSPWRGMITEGPGLFWLAVYGVVAGVMPLRLMESLRGESDGRNAELLLLGGLTRWQIVRGKWLVQAVLTLLSLVSLLPYMLVRYFFGGVELVPNAFSFVSVTAAALGMSGCVVGASGYAGLGMRFFVIAVAGLLLTLAGLSTETMIANARGVARLSDLSLFAYIYGYAILFHALYAMIGLQLGRAHLKLFLTPHEISPTKGMVAMLLTAPFMLLAGGIATCGWGSILVLMLLIYAVSAFDKTPPGAEWAVRRPGK
jgi:hypothetical protein